MYGQYRVVERIAVGGMAEIYRGVARGVEGFERPVVIKRVHPRFSEDRRFVNMLIREAKITARLTHPNIVQILDLGRHEGEYFIVMEYVEGHDLAAVMHRATKRDIPLGLDAVLYLTSEICDALAHAHALTDDDGRSLKLIHRDVSPSNVLISHEGEVKLTDFGVARFGRDVSLVGSLKGKLAYMSPEQARAQRIDHRSDVFSVGAVLFEMVLGRRVFLAETDIEMLNAVRFGQIPRPSAIDPSISTELERILLRALAPVEGRYQSAGELSAAIKAHRFEASSARAGAAEIAALLERLFGQPEPKRGEAARFTIDRLAPLRQERQETDEPPLAPPSFDDTTNPEQPSPAVLAKLRRSSDDDEDLIDGSLKAPATEPGLGKRAPMVNVITGIHLTEGRPTERYTPVGIDETDSSVTQVEAPDLEALQREAERFDAGAVLAGERTDPEIPAHRLGVRAGIGGLGPVLSQRMSDAGGGLKSRPAVVPLPNSAKRLGNRADQVSQVEADDPDRTVEEVAPLYEGDAQATAPETPATRSGRRAPAAVDIDVKTAETGVERPGVERPGDERPGDERPRGKWDPLARERRASRVSLLPTATIEEPPKPADLAESGRLKSGAEQAPLGATPFDLATVDQPPSAEELAAATRPSDTSAAALAKSAPAVAKSAPDDVYAPLATGDRVSNDDRVPNDDGLFDEPAEQSVPLVAGSFDLPAEAVPLPIGQSQPGVVASMPAATETPRRKAPRGGYRLPVMIGIAVVGLAIGLGGAYLAIVLIKGDDGAKRGPSVASVAAPASADAAAGANNPDPEAADAGVEDAPAVAARPEPPTPPPVIAKPKPKPRIVRPKRSPRIAKPKPRPRPKPAVGLRPYRPRPTARPKPKPRGFGQLVIESEPWAYIHVDGRNTRKVTSARPIRVPAGRRRIKLVNPALNMQKTLVVEIEAGETVRRFVSLR